VTTLTFWPRNFAIRMFVRLSVRLSVTLVIYAQTVQDIHITFHTER